jgi:hypothetical protein
MRQPAKRLLRQTCAWVAAFAATAAISAASAPAAVALPADFWGVVPQTPPSLEQLQRLSRGGVESIRVPIGWNSVQPTENGRFDWTSSDALVRGAAEAGIDVLPFLSNAPAWAVPPAWVPGTHHGMTTPQHLPVSGAARVAWMSFVSQAVARYGPYGSFWAENPALPQRPIRTWQIWNEPNFKYFVARPNPAEYAKLVKISSTALRSADPGAKLVLGGLFAWPREAAYRRRPRQAYYATEFLSQMFRSAPGIRSRFEGVALHPYTSTYRYLGRQITEVRTVLKANHDPNAGLWITEMGWSSGYRSAANGRNEFEKGPRGQAQQLKGAFTLLRNKQRKWLVQRVYWFSVDDAPGACNFCDGSGLFGPGFVPKPAWYAYVRFTGGTP